MSVKPLFIVLLLLFMLLLLLLTFTFWNMLVHSVLFVVFCKELYIHPHYAACSCVITFSFTVLQTVARASKT